MIKLLQISKQLRLVLFNQLKRPINSERLRFKLRRLLAQRPSPRREPSSTKCNSNLMLRKLQQNKLAKTQTRRVFLIKLDFKVSARE
jgi:hypothetical protein